MEDKNEGIKRREKEKRKARKNDLRQSEGLSDKRERLQSEVFEAANKRRRYERVAAGQKFEERLQREILETTNEGIKSMKKEKRKSRKHDLLQSEVLSDKRERLQSEVFEAEQKRGSTRQPQRRRSLRNGCSGKFWRPRMRALRN